MTTPLKISSGKVRDIYDAGPGKLFILTSDRISAFDVVMPTPIPGKGAILNAMSAFWFDFFGNIIPSHIITQNSSDFPAPFNNDTDSASRGMVVKKLNMLPFECIVRGYISGSAWASYKKDGTVCGISVPTGLRESEKLPSTLFTPSTKAESGHDINISFEEMKSMLGAKLSCLVRDASIKLYESAAAYALERGIIIADTKFEFGLDENGTLVLADEVLTPDSSRFWPAKDHTPGQSAKSFDKQYLRDWLKHRGLDGVSPAPELPSDVVCATLAKYKEAYSLLTGCAEV